MRSPKDSLGRLRRALGQKRHVVVISLSAAVLAVVLGQRVEGAGDRSTALVRALRKRGVVAAPGDVRWVDSPPGAVKSLACGVRAVVRGAAAKGEPNDLYLAFTRLSPEGVLLRVCDVYNLTETSGADEGAPIVRGQRAAYVAEPLIAEGKPTVHVLELGGQQASTLDWTGLEKKQNAITNWQQTGQLGGVGKRTFAIESEAAKEAHAGPDRVSIDLSGGELTIQWGDRSGAIDLDAERPSLPAWIRSEPPDIAKPGNLVTWGVDRVRAIPWIGDDTMQTVKAVAFTLLDFVLRNKEAATGETGEKDIASDLGKNELDPPTRTLPVDPDIGWPPAPLEPWVFPTLPGEGQWNPLDRDPYVRKNEGLPPAFLTTFIRSDRSRKVTRVYIALWDPRQIELHMMAGSIEPKSATGEAGPGLIPRTPEVMKRVVAASNAGFQAMHGEFGMMADGVVYLPPKPYAATVAVTRDGSTAFGTWPADTSIPATILSYRQNMTVMVQDEKFNPYGRTWWGGTPPGWEDKTHTVRTGICTTKERFVAYFYGADLSPDALAQAMIQARCSYGIALDMNAGHSGLEFYKVAPAAEFEPLAQPLQTDWQAEGDLPGLEGWKFRGRRLIRGMGLMHFPRYIKREGRDFFYMTLRPALPGAALAGSGKDEGVWTLKGLPQHGFPYALASTEITAGPATKLRVLKIDPRTVTGTPASKPSDKTVAVIDGTSDLPVKGGAEELSLWHSAGAFSIAATAPVAEATRLAVGAAGGAAAAALGVSDDDGMLVYVELAKPPPQASPADGKLLDDVLEKAGCSQRILLGRALALALGGDTDLAGAAIHAPSGPSAVRLVRVEAPGAKRIFEDTPVVPITTWYPLQQQRIRYFKKPQGQDSSGEEP